MPKQSGCTVNVLVFSAFFLFIASVFFLPRVSYADIDKSASSDQKAENSASEGLEISESVTPFPPDLDDMFKLFRDRQNFCGDGILSEDEQCDATAEMRGDISCNRNCQIYDKSLCGNGKKDPGEQCDPDDGAAALSGCAQDCTFTVTLNSPRNCNNGILEAGEACDKPGQIVQRDGAAFACNTVCELQATANCGNGIVELGEECDGGLESGCSNFCTKVSYCGDGILTGNEECDDHNTENNDGCSSSCRHEILCGDGRKEGWELCDDGNTLNGDGCSSDCRIEAICGNAQVQIGEQCDDGNKISGDGCSAECRTEEINLCGNGKLDSSAGEQCEEGIAGCSQFQSCKSCTCVDLGGCKVGSDCAAGQICISGLCSTSGDENCSKGFTCSQGMSCINDKCTLGDGGSCSKGAECSKGMVCDPNTDTCKIVDPGEGGGLCKQDSDCSSGMYCNVTDGTCKPIVCGDTITSTGEECDDGNKTDCDGCTQCKKTANVSCTAAVCKEGDEYHQTDKCLGGYEYDGSASCICSGQCEMAEC